MTTIGSAPNPPKPAAPARFPFTVRIGAFFNYVAFLVRRLRGK